MSCIPSSFPCSNHHLKAPTSVSDHHWTEISPIRKAFRIPLADIWAYRDLIYLFVRRDFVASYKQTVLGPLWYLIQPLTSTLVFTIVFSGIARIPTAGAPAPLFYFAGILCWSYFSDCLSKTSSTFRGNAGLFEKVYFPRLCVPMATVISNLVSFTLQFAMFFIVWAYYFFFRGDAVTISWDRLILLPILVAQMAFLGMGVGCIVSSLTTRYRDLAMLISFGTQLWMYASCVVYPLGQIPEQWRGWLLLNPMVPIIETFRWMLFNSSGISFTAWLISFGTCVAVFLLGLLTFNRVEQSFTDTI